MTPQPGDLIVPLHVGDEILLFSDAWNDQPMRTEQPLCAWGGDVIGLLLDVNVKYGQNDQVARVLVGSTVGYTFADYVRRA